MRCEWSSCLEDLFQWRCERHCSAFDGSHLSLTWTKQWKRLSEIDLFLVHLHGETCWYIIIQIFCLVKPFFSWNASHWAALNKSLERLYLHIFQRFRIGWIIVCKGNLERGFGNRQATGWAKTHVLGTSHFWNHQTTTLCANGLTLQMMQKHHQKIRVSIFFLGGIYWYLGGFHRLECGFFMFFDMFYDHEE